MHHKTVIIEWGDAFIDTNDFTVEEADDTEPVWRHTIGFLIAKNQYGYVLATDVYSDPEEGVAAKMFIPHGMVLSVTYLEKASV